MTSILREKIREKIADQDLQSALDGNAERRVHGRLNAFASLPDWRERRQRAHAARAEVVTHLDEYLAQFMAKVRANGIQVHLAKDAAEAVQLVLSISEAQRKPGALGLLFAKAKSMLSEEIGLNHALEAAGHRVVETDLGEYIVQLRGERPAHLLTPAVHLRRQQVGQLFHEKLGIPYTEDIPTLTGAARERLRQVFLEADIGLSGVNFGVVETGTLTLVTNEGNGRMCATLPPVHIALMGMERLLPSLDDLALLLSLLPRAATGQKLSVYTQLIHAPENGQQKHLIIVDNGRTRLRASPLKEALYCIRCGSCLNACPVFREVGGHAYLGSDGAMAPYPGPIGVVLSTGLLGENYAPLAQASSLCGACKEACPVDIDLPKMLLRIRAGEFATEKEPAAPAHAGQGLPAGLKLGLGLYGRIASRPWLFAALQKLAGWVSTPLPDLIPLPDASGWGASKHFPRPAARPFREIYPGLAAPPVMELPTQPIPTALQLPTVPAAPDFAAELAAVGGQIHPVTAAELSPKLVAFLRERGLTRLQTWEELPLLDLADLRAAGIRIEHTPDADIRAGLTGALAGITQSGTLLIPGGAGRALTASLLPPIHIAILEKARMLDTLEDALRLPEVARCAASVLVTGPSRTADIEMSLTIGMHGPRELHVFLVDGAAGK